MKTISETIVSTCYAMPAREAAARRNDASLHLDRVRNRVDEILTFAELTTEHREQLTQAANALELAAACIRYNGPRKAIKIGF